MNAKIAIIGLGNMGQNHVRVLSALPNVSLVAVCDNQKQRAKATANVYHCLPYFDHKKLLKENDCDGVIIAVSTHLHYAIALDCLRAGKHILIEKPITSTMREARSLIALAKKKKVVLTVGHVERFNPAVQKLHHLIQKGRLGKITSIVAKRVGGFPPRVGQTNVITDLAVHDIDIINYLLKATPRKVYSSIRKAFGAPQEDCGEIFLKYKDASAFIQVNWITPVKIRNLSVTGTQGYAELNYITQKLTLYESNFSQKAVKRGKGFSDFILKFGEPDKMEVAIETAEPLKTELEDFIAAIGGKPSAVTPEEALAALTVAQTINNQP